MGEDPSDDDQTPADGLGPFGNIPMFAEMARMLSGQGPLNWEAARQFAAGAATQGASEPNVDPRVRFEFADLARLASHHVNGETGIELFGAGHEPQILTLTRGAWAQRTLDAYKPLFTQLATSLGQRDAGDDPAGALMAGLSQMLAPSMMGMAIGSMVGQLATRAFGEHDMPLPRPTRGELAVVPGNIDPFAAEWSLARDDLRLWVLVHELTAQSLFSIPHVAATLLDRVRAYAGAFRPDPTAVFDKLADVDDVDLSPDSLTDPDAMAQMAGNLERVFSDPEVLLGAVRTAEHERLAPPLDALLALVVGWIDHMTDTVGARLLGNGSPVGEAVRRRRLEATPDDIFVERLLGLRLDRRQVERGKAFIAGVIDRAGPDGLTPLYENAQSLPTPAEIDAPGLWLARLQIDD